MLSNVNVQVQVNGEVQSPLVMTHSKATVTNVDAIVVPANANRKYLLIANNSDADIIINLGSAIVENKGILLKPCGSFQISKDYLFVGEVHATHNTIGNKGLDITEGE